jgi:hypothetical protein
MRTATRLRDLRSPGSRECARTAATRRGADLFEPSATTARPMRGDKGNRFPPGLIDARQWQYPLQNGAEADQHHEQLEKLG